MRASMVASFREYHAPPPHYSHPERPIFSRLGIVQGGKLSDGEALLDFKKKYLKNFRTFGAGNRTIFELPICSLIIFNFPPKGAEKFSENNCLNTEQFLRFAHILRSL